MAFAVEAELINFRLTILGGQVVYCFGKILLESVEAFWSKPEKTVFESRITVQHPYIMAFSGEAFLHVGFPPWRASLREALIKLQLFSKLDPDICVTETDAYKASFLY